MQCPFCQVPLSLHAPECPECRLTFPRTDALVGALPRLAPGLADLARVLPSGDQSKLKKRIVEIQARFPQLVMQIVVHHFPTAYPFSMHAFWLLNAGNFAGDSRRGKDNHSLLIALDPTRGEAAIVPGYGLESFLKTETLDHLLELAGPSWESSRWADGLFRVLNGLDQILESISVVTHNTPRLGEF